MVALVGVGDGGYDVADGRGGGDDNGVYRGDGDDGGVRRNNDVLMVVIGVLCTNQEYLSDIKQKPPGDRVGPSSCHPLESHGR